MKCLLCNSHSDSFEVDYFQCSYCDLVFKNPKLFLDTKAEFQRYLKHENNIEDLGYMSFLKKLIEPIEGLISKNTTHLDFGSGANPAFEYLLKDKVKSSVAYDLYFFPDRKFIEKKYTLVTCSEVVEHFIEPEKSWNELISTVESNGLLAVMTSFLTPEINFKNWWYKNDKTHIVFYSEKTFKYLCEKFRLEIIFNDHQSRIIFKKVE